MMDDNIVASIKSDAMQPVQIIAVGMCVVINMLDGFDVLVMAFTAPEIAREWQLEPQSLGILFSSGLLGMALGSLFIAPLADWMGRRRIILICLVIISLGMLASAFMNSVASLVSTRIITGLGIGGMLASITTITAEYSSDVRRGFCISLVQSGYPIGATIGGSIAAVLIVQYGWREVFIFGAVSSALMIPLVFLLLPESLDYLITRQPKAALERINELLRRLGKGVLDSLPDPSGLLKPARMPVLGLLTPNLVKTTVLIWLAFFMVMMSFYFVLSWTPTLLTEAGLNVEQGISGGVLVNIGGIIGGVSLGYLTARFTVTKLVAWFMVMCAIAMAAFGLSQSGLTLMLVFGFVIGFFVFGSMIGLYAITPNSYDTSIRNTGMGWAIGVGRIGAVVGPLIAGFLLNRGWSGADCFVVFAVPLIIAMIAVSSMEQPVELTN